MINRAFGRLNIDPLEDLDDDSFGASSAALTYDSVVEFCLGCYVFSWAKEMRVLSPRADEIGLFGYRNVFDMPGDALGPPVRVTDDPRDPDRIFNRYVLSGNTVQADEPVLYAEVKFVPPPVKWPGTFREAVTLALAAEFALGQVDDKGMRDGLRADAFGSPSVFPRGGALGAAIAEDARATPPRRAPVGNNPLTNAWKS
ncbi:hypothetical protein [Kaistia sp. MMO-174]|uniref:hypothetical protein n=1 Tax=Kaistia sp. MMO-174 TaxID=3081256 RepID=UPI003019ABFE